MPCIMFSRSPLYLHNGRCAWIFSFFNEYGVVRYLCSLGTPAFGSVTITIGFTVDVVRQMLFLFVLPKYVALIFML